MTSNAPAGRPVIRIGLLWHSLSSGNLGIGALTVANHAIARQVAESMGLEPHFVVMQMPDAGIATIDLPNTQVVRINRQMLTSPDGFWKNVGSVDCVLDIGAGDSFADIYGPKRFMFLWLTKLMAVMRGIPLLLSPQTIGPFTKTAYRIPAAWIMNRSTAVIARDPKSREIAESMAPKTRVEMAVDVAFVLPFDDRSSERGGKRIRVGVNASGLLFHQAETGRNRFGLSYDYAAFTRALLTALSARDDVDLFLVPHATSKTMIDDDDGALADRLHAEFPRAQRVPNFDTASAAKTFISSLDLLVAGRMHACIGAFSSRTPVIPVAYSRKFSGLFGLLDYPDMLPVSGMDEDAALAYVLAAIDRLDELAAKEAKGMTVVNGLLDVYRGTLRDLYTTALERRR
ncbi:polysaccharide pyruvyl transferase family protein [Sphingomonas sp. FW199]|uniref:polysaccharide pyruvyl transferase family protein n=1 Tax=Sphingomonas sp. FW199 TaxID=3400217 RepID=UPI003CED0AE9